jgi:hypothetical protein
MCTYVKMRVTIITSCYVCVWCSKGWGGTLEQYAVCCSASNHANSSGVLRCHCSRSMLGFKVRPSVLQRLMWLWSALLVMVSCVILHAAAMSAGEVGDAKCLAAAAGAFYAQR